MIDYDHSTLTMDLLTGFQRRRKEEKESYGESFRTFEKMSRKS